MSLVESTDCPWCKKQIVVDPHSECGTEIKCPYCNEYSLYQGDYFQINDESVWDFWLERNPDENK